MTYYETLGVSKDATPEQIKRAWRKKCREHHPDREGGSADRMQAVNKAYECLWDPERRANYDRTGEDITGPSLDDVVRNEVIGLFSAVADSTAESGLLAAARRMVSGRKSHFEMDQMAAKQRQRWLEKKRGKIRVRTKTSDLYAEVINGKLAELQSKLEMLAKQIEVCVAIDRYLDDYESVDDEVPVEKSIKFMLPQHFGSTSA